MAYETWKNIPSFDGLLQASDQGRIREYIVVKNNKKEIVYVDRIIAIAKNGVAKYKNTGIKAARLVAEAFIKKFDNECLIQYKDGDSTNLKPDNLILVPASYVYPKGQDNYQAKLKDSDVLDICEKLIRGESAIQIAKNYGIHPNNVYRIARNEIWTHVERPKISIRNAKKTNSINKLIKSLSKQRVYLINNELIK